MAKNPLLRKKAPKLKFNNVGQSKGILDDFAVRKNVATREGTVEKVPVNDSDIANKKYVDDEIAAIPAPVNYWDRTGTTLSPDTAGDDISSGTGKFLMGSDLEIVNNGGNIELRNLTDTKEIQFYINDDTVDTEVMTIKEANFANAGAVDINGGTHATSGYAPTLNVLGGISVERDLSAGAYLLSIWDDWDNSLSGYIHQTATYLNFTNKKNGAVIRFQNDDSGGTVRTGLELRYYSTGTSSYNYLKVNHIPLWLTEDNQKLQMGATATDFQLYSDGTNANIDFSGSLKVNGTAGFTGTGAYTNFTIVDGIITAAS